MDQRGGGGCNGAVERTDTPIFHDTAEPGLKPAENARKLAYEQGRGAEEAA